MRGASRSRGSRIAALACLLTASLTGCAQGFSAQTLQTYQPAEGVNVNTPDNDLHLRNALIELRTGSTGLLSFTLVNQSLPTDSRDAADTLISISAPGAKVAGFTPVAIPAGSAVKSAPNLTVTGTAVKVGFTIPLVFQFKNGGSVTANVQTYPTGFFAQSK